MACVARFLRQHLTWRWLVVDTWAALKTLRYHVMTCQLRTLSRDSLGQVSVLGRVSVTVSKSQIYEALRIVPLHFQAGCHRRRLDMPLFCVAVFLFWLVNVCFCYVSFSFSIPSQDIGLWKVSEMICFCVVKAQLNQCCYMCVVTEGRCRLSTHCLYCCSWLHDRIVGQCPTWWSPCRT